MHTKSAHRRLARIWMPKEVVCEGTSPRLGPRKRMKAALALGVLLIVGSSVIFSRPAFFKWFQGPRSVVVSASSVPARPWVREPRRNTELRLHSKLSAANPFVPTAPTNLRVTTAANQSIELAWDAPSGSFANYRIERSTTFTATPNFVANVSAGTTTYTDSLGTGVHSYLYRVRTVNIFGDMSPPSNLAMGTTITFTDSTLTAGVTEIKAQHIYDLRNAVNAVRALTSMSTGSWTTASLEQQIVHAVDVQELRDQLNAALSAVQVSTSNYTDNTLATGANGTLIKKVHIEELRTRSTKGQSSSSGPADNFVDSTTARLDALNRTGGGGDDPLSRNANWSVPLVSLPGRSGLDLGLSLSYNSLATWTKHGNVISFDDDYGFPAPGFRLGFPVIEPMYYNAQAAKNSYLMITPSGARVELRQVGSSALYQAVDSSYMLLDSNSMDSMVLRTTDGTKLTYVWKVDDYKCIEIKDRNGNVITVNYDATTGRLTSVVDTLNRTITFNYTNGDLTSISQSWGGSTSHYWARFSYENKTIDTNFSTSLAVYGPADNTTIRLLTQVKFADDSYYAFDNTSWGQVWKISQYTGESTPTLLNYRSYNLPVDASSSYDDCPRFTQRYDWAKYWNRDGSGDEQAVPTTFAAPSSVSIPNTSQTGLLAKVTQPDGTYQKLYYGSSAGSPAWQHGLLLRTDTYDSSDTVQRTATTAWTQDVTTSGTTYQLNPRVTETNISDPAGNLVRSIISYAANTLDGTTVNLPEDVREYEANGTTQLRRTHIEYNLSSTYTSTTRRIIGLVSEKSLYSGASGSETLMSKVTFEYDASGSLQGTDAPVQHDNDNFSSSVVAGRGNVSSVTRHNVSNSSTTTSTIKYNTAGSVVSSTDPLSHTVGISYSDSFSDNGNSRNTLAYPTTITDPGSFTTTTKYNFDFGAVTSKQTPMPNYTTNTAGPIQYIAYDSIGRVQQLTNSVNSAYTKYQYGPNFVRTYSTVNNASDEAMSLKVFDGHGRVFATVGNHPGSTGGYSGQLTIYDGMGRVSKVSNPIESALSSYSLSATVNPYAWEPAGDDATSNGGTGWIYTQQTYDWKGRPLVTTNPDNTTKSASYAGCGCAGGEVVTLTDEVNRKVKVFSDVLGRKWKTEVLGSSNNVYSATASMFDGRDQITSVKSYKGAAESDLSCPTQTCMQSVTTYDGYGRVASRRLPQQSAATTYEYNTDDTVHTITDPRGVVATNTYDSRRLLTEVAYTPVTGVDSLASVSFAYDAAGNRTSMTDAMGTMTYGYDALSRMTGEARYLTGFGGAYSINYSYNLASQLTSITDPSGAQVTYTYDLAGRLTSMPGSGYTGVSNFLSNSQYRASGAIKQTTYGNGIQLGLTYNSRLEIGQYRLSGTNFTSTMNVTYYNDGRTDTAFYSSASPFDRKYEFDFNARLKEAYSGPEAHGASAPPLNEAASPYRQSYTYDEWNDVTQRAGRIWTQNDYETPGGAESDAAGNITNKYRDGIRTYDCAGRPVTFASEQNWQVFPNWPSGHPDAPALETQDIFDGEGLVVKHVNHTRHDDSTSDLNGENIVYWMSESTTTTYYLHSTVLGGKTIVELDQNGVKTKGHVYAGGARLATQTVATGSDSVQYEATNPVTGTAFTTDASGNRVSQVEPDPLGRDLTTAPDSTLVLDPVSGSKWNEPLYLEYQANWTGEMESGMRQYQKYVNERTAIYIYNATKRDFIMALLDLARTGENKYYDKAQKILSKNPNFRISINGDWVAGRDAANALNGAMASLPGNPLGISPSPAQQAKGSGDRGEYKRELTNKEWDKLKDVFDAAREALDNPDCSKWISDNITRWTANPKNDLNTLIKIKHFFYGGAPGSIATTYDAMGAVQFAWIGLRKSFFRQGFYDQVETILHELRHASSLTNVLHPEDLGNDMVRISNWRLGGGVVETQDEFHEGAQRDCIKPLREARRKN